MDTRMRKSISGRKRRHQGKKRQEKNETEDVDAEPSANTRPPVTEKPGKDRDRIMRQLKLPCELHDFGGGGGGNCGRVTKREIKASKGSGLVLSLRISSVIISVSVFFLPCFSFLFSPCRLIVFELASD